MVRNDLKTTLLEFYEAMRANKPSWAASLFESDAVHEVFAVHADAPFEGEYRGRDAIREHLSGIIERFKVEAIAIDDINLDGDRGLVRVRTSARQKETGSLVTTSESHVFQLSLSGLSRLDVFVEEVRTAPCTTSRVPAPQAPRMLRAAR